MDRLERLQALSTVRQEHCILLLKTKVVTRLAILQFRIAALYIKAVAAYGDLASFLMRKIARFNRLFNGHLQPIPTKDSK